MFMDLKVGSMIPEDLSTKCNVGSLIPLDPTTNYNSGYWIPMDPYFILQRILDPTGSHYKQ